MSVLVREFREADEDFLYSSWLHSFRYCLVNLGMGKDEYYRTFHKRIEEILKGAEVKVACEDSDPELIMGYVVYGQREVYWVYVKEDFRKLGVGTKLLESVFERLGERELTYPFSSFRFGDDGGVWDGARKLKARFCLEYSPWR